MSILLIPTPPDLVRMRIEMHLNYDLIFAFLQRKGYEILPFLWKYQDESFPAGQTNHESHTWTATKPGEVQCENNLYLNVFENEIKKLLKDIN